MIVALAAMQAVAGTVDHATAQGKAAAFLKAQAGNTKFAAAPVEFTSERVVTNSANVALPVYYIFNTRDRFIIVSGEDRGEEILAVGDGTLDLNNIPTNMQYWLDFYKKPRSECVTAADSPMGPDNALLESVRLQQHSVPDGMPCYFIGTSILLLEISDSCHPLTFWLYYRWLHYPCIAFNDVWLG